MYKTKYGTGLKTISPKQMLQRLPITLAQVQAGNNSENYIWILKLTDKLDLRKGGKSITWSKLSICYIWKNIKGSYKNNRFKISIPTWNDEFELPDESYFISDIQEYYEN